MTFITTDEASQIANVSKQLLYKEINNGNIAALKPGKSYIIQPDALYQWMESRTEQHHRKKKSVPKTVHDVKVLSWLPQDFGPEAYEQCKTSFFNMGGSDVHLMKLGKDKYAVVSGHQSFAAYYFNKTLPSLTTDDLKPTFFLVEANACFYSQEQLERFFRLSEDTVLLDFDQINFCRDDDFQGHDWKFTREIKELKED